MDEPPEKELQTASFVVHTTRGVIRDQSVRRKVMFVLLIVALLLVFSGITFLSETLNPREYPGRFMLFWFACGWLALTSMLLAAFDLLMVRAQARKTERLLHERFPDDETPDSPNAGDGH
jgi:membrane protein CcdC involved in cytochrome C biogenesis